MFHDFLVFCYFSTSEEIGWNERLLNNLVLCEVGCKPLTRSISLSVIMFLCCITTLWRLKNIASFSCWPLVWKPVVCKKLATVRENSCEVKKLFCVNFFTSATIPVFSRQLLVVRCHCLFYCFCCLWNRRICNDIYHGCWGLMHPGRHCIFWCYIDCLYVCFCYHLIPFASCNLLSFSLGYIFFSFFPLRIPPGGIVSVPDVIEGD